MSFLQPATASAVTRPEAVYGLPPARNWSSNAGYCALFGPIDVHAPTFLPFLKALNVATEFSVAENGTDSAGYARCAACSASAVLFGPSFAMPALSPIDSPPAFSAVKLLPFAVECDDAAIPATSAAARAVTATRPQTTHMRLVILTPLSPLERPAGAPGSAPAQSER